MSIDLENLRLDIPEEDFSKPDGVSRTWRLTTVVLFLLVGGLVWLHWVAEPPSKNSDKVSISTATVAPASAELETKFTAGGWVEPQLPYPIKVSTQVPGLLDLLFVVEGQRIDGPVGMDEGQTVAMLNSDIYSAQLEESEAKVTAQESLITAIEAKISRLEEGPREEEIEIAQAAVNRAQARVDILEAGFRQEDIDAAEAQLREAKALAIQKRSRADRFAELAAKEQVPLSKAEEYAAAATAAEEEVQACDHKLSRLQAGYREVDVDEAKAALAEAESKLALLEAGTRQEDIDEAEANLAAAEARLEAIEAEKSLIEWRIEQCDIKAPATGKVLELIAHQGTMMTDKAAVLFTMYDPSKMQVRVDVRQEQAASLSVGQLATIKLEARKGKPYKGVVTRVDPLANLARDTVRAKVEILAPDDFLRKDMTVTVDFHPKEATAIDGEKVIVVPAAAVTKRDGKTYVFMVRDGLVALREVELGEELSGNFPVKSGVVDGDVVATSNLSELADGAAVSLGEGE
ncbi:MAG: efflux RND transporter periplasmic adaptor subunit [Planctomycetota bacterium]|jgi:HlyD family secretion protein